MKGSGDQDEPLARLRFKTSFPLIASALACVLFGSFLALGVRALWQLDGIPATSTFKEQMMHRKSRAMAQISDGLVRGDLRRVEASAEHMWEIGQALNWYMSSDLYENHEEIFHDSTNELIEAARQGDHAAAKESALRLERSCIDCHVLINRDQPRS